VTRYSGAININLATNPNKIKQGAQAVKEEASELTSRVKSSGTDELILSLSCGWTTRVFYREDWSASSLDAVTAFRNTETIASEQGGARWVGMWIQFVLTVVNSWTLVRRRSCRAAASSVG
jgi:hypothetical protein